MAVRNSASPAGGPPRQRKRTRTRADEKAERGEGTPTGDAVRRGHVYVQIYVEWRRGIAIAALAELHSITPRRAQQIVDEMRADTFEGYDVESPVAGLQVLDSLMVQMEEAVSQAAQLVERALDENNLNVALGALKRVAEARRELLELKIKRGIVPKQMEWLHVQASGITLARALIDVLDRHGVPQEAMAEIADLVSLRVREDQGRVELDVRAGTRNGEVVEGCRRDLGGAVEAMNGSSAADEARPVLLRPPLRAGALLGERPAMPRKISDAASHTMNTRRTRA